jgi:acetoin utilization deacetylase AcuC-like enzyme
MPFPGPVLDIAAAHAYLDGTAGTADGAGGIERITRQDLERFHSGDFTAALYGEAPASGLSALETALLAAYELIDPQGKPRRYEPDRAKKPLAGLFRVILAQVEGTYLACRLALTRGPGFCFYLGGGMHHARYDAGSGFCLLNDIAVAAGKIFALAPDKFCGNNPVRLIWVVDLDAHKGDGTAELVRFARERGELAGPAETGGTAATRQELPCMFTLSVHMAGGWPLDEESLAQAEPGRAPLVASDIDIGIGPGEEADYVPRLKAGIEQLEALSRARRPDKPAPDLVIVVDGADPYEHDELPSTAPLGLTLEQCLDRDLFVYRYVSERDLPSAWIMAGGYGRRAWEPPAHFLQYVR